MTVNSSQPKRLKCVVSVSEMARMVGLSRARFYDLVRRGVFHHPVYSLANRRPLYLADQQEANLTARETGIGVNGEYVLFYERRPQQSDAGPHQAEHPRLAESLKSLGVQPSAAQLQAALKACFPQGTGEVGESEVLRAVFRHLKRKGAA